ncbi:MAG: nitroreductase family protein, partial [Thermoproteota archaeon]
LRSCGMVAQTIMLAAKSMGYDTCPMKGFDYGEVGKLIHLPDDHVISMMVVVGKAIKSASSRGGQLPLSEIMFENSF